MSRLPATSRAALLLACTAALLGGLPGSVRAASGGQHEPFHLGASYLSHDGVFFNLGYVLGCLVPERADPTDPGERAGVWVDALGLTLGRGWDGPSGGLSLSGSLSTLMEPLGKRNLQALDGTVSLTGLGRAASVSGSFWVYPGLHPAGGDLRFDCVARGLYLRDRGEDLAGRPWSLSLGSGLSWASRADAPVVALLRVGADLRALTSIRLVGVAEAALRRYVGMRRFVEIGGRAGTGGRPQIALRLGGIARETDSPDVVSKLRALGWSVGLSLNGTAPWWGGFDLGAFALTVSLSR